MQTRRMHEGKNEKRVTFQKEIHQKWVGERTAKTTSSPCTLRGGHNRKQTFSTEKKTLEPWVERREPEIKEGSGKRATRRRREPLCDGGVGEKHRDKGTGR